MKPFRFSLFSLLLCLILTACKSSLTQSIFTPITGSPTQESPTPTTWLIATSIGNGNPTPSILSTTATQKIEITNPVPTIELKPDDWMKLPILPQPSNKMKQIFKLGVESGNNPRSFSKIGDCGSAPSWFLGDFDRGPRYYNLGSHEELQGVIDYYAGSFARTSLAAQSGFSTSSIITALWANRKFCNPDENPLACEYRVNKPVLALIMLGTNDVYHIDSFEPQMRQIIEYSLEAGVIPVLGTKADNIEKNHEINQTLAHLALEYQIPLWNYWAAVQPIENHGLQEDNAHITWGPNQFNDPQVMQKGWPVRNLTALQTLDSIWKTVDVLDQIP